MTATQDHSRPLKGTQPYASLGTNPGLLRFVCFELHDADNDDDGKGKRNETTLHSNAVIYITLQCVVAILVSGCGGVATDKLVSCSS